MTDQEMRVAIAEWCGWIKCVCGDPECGAWFAPSGEVSLGPPNYPADLNAMHEPETMIACGRFREYTETLEKVVAHPNAKEDELRYDLLHATARQRAEALLRTIGRWKD